MQGRAFLDLAKEIIQGNTEVHWRGAAGRIYYGLMLEFRDALQRWGFTAPPRMNVHAFVRLRFTFAANADLKAIGGLLDSLSQLRNRADYQLGRIREFLSSAVTQQALQEAQRHLAVLDSVNSDPSRNAAAVAAIRKAFP